MAREKEIKEVKDLPGIGPLAAEKLFSAGYKNLEAVAVASPMELKEAAGLGDGTADKAIKAAFRGEHLVSRKQHSRVRITTKGLLLRDVQGRVREDVSAVAEWGEMREAASFGSIVSGTKSIVLDHDRNVALVKPGSPSSASGAAASPLFPGTHFQVVGRADIAGCDCREVAFWSDPPADHSLQGSAWICDELGLVLKEIGESKEESYSWEVTRLERVEPAASEFRIPEGYDAYDVTGIGTLTPRDR